jgi:hypothetical protein
MNITYTTKPKEVMFQKRNIGYIIVTFPVTGHTFGSFFVALFKVFNF